MGKKQVKVVRYSEYYMMGFKDGVYGLGIALDCSKKNPYIEGYVAGQQTALMAQKQAEKNNA